MTVETPPTEIIGESRRTISAIVSDLPSNTIFVDKASESKKGSYTEALALLENNEFLIKDKTILEREKAHYRKLLALGFK